MAKMLFPVLLLMLFPCLVRAGNDTIPGSRKIAAMSDLVSLKMTLSSDIEKVGVITPGTDIRLSPNEELAARLGFSYRFISFGIRFVPKFIGGNNDNSEKGKSSSHGLSIGFNFRHWMQELYYTRTRGYYLENTADFDPAWTAGKPYVQFPDLVVSQYAGSTAYNFNKDFSTNAMLMQSERQLQSAGSFIPVLYYRYYIHDDKARPSSGGFTQKGNNVELLLGAGYHYNFVYRQKWYLAVGLTPATGYVFSRITTRFESYTTSGNQRNFIFRLDGRAGIGYNSDRFFTGIYMRSLASAYHQRKTPVITENDQAVFHAVIGFRLQAPSWIKKPVEAVTRRIGIK